MSKPRGRWKCLWSCIVLSRRLAHCSFLAEIIYTRGIPVSDAYGVLRRDDVAKALLPGRKGAHTALIEKAIDELVGLKLLCQQGTPRVSAARVGEGEVLGMSIKNGEGLRQASDPPYYLHWCFHDDYQGEKHRKGRGSPLFEFFCPNENRAIHRDTPRYTAIPRGD